MPRKRHPKIATKEQGDWDVNQYREQEPEKTLVSEIAALSQCIRHCFYLFIGLKIALLLVPFVIQLFVKK